jgi:hypothetical protein
MQFETYVKVLLLASALVAPITPGASAEPNILLGKMSWWQRVVGSWACDVEIKPTEGQPAKWVTVAKGSVAPNNVFRWTEIAPGNETHQYDGYSANRRIWWETQADSSGYATVLRSTDGLIYDQVSVPSPLEEDQSMYREIYSLRADGTFHLEVERQASGTWRFYSESSCKRIPPTNSITLRAAEPLHKSSVP